MHGGEVAGDLLPDGAKAPHQDVGIDDRAQATFRAERAPRAVGVVLPAPLALGREHLGYLADPGQCECEGGLGDGEVVQTTPVGDGDLRGEVGGQDAVGACGQRLDPPQVRGLTGKLRDRGGRPALDDGAIGVEVLGRDGLIFVDRHNLDALGGLELERGISGGKNLHVAHGIGVAAVARRDGRT